MASTRFKVSVAVDIGGNSTGYAVKFFDRNSDDILYSRWNDNEDHKTKTCALFSPTKEFVAFGQEAEVKLMELRKQGDDKKWFLFDNIKRVLLGKCTQDTTIVTENRKWMYATDVFEALFVYFRIHVLRTCTDHGHPVDDSQIQWIYVIPSGTESTTGAVLHQCAKQVGLDVEQFVFVSDTRSIAKYMITAYGSHLEDVFKEGSNFMVCDIGGLSVDIGAYNVRKDLDLDEVYTKHDIQHGSDSIVDAYLSRLTEFLGANVMQALNDYHPQKKDELVKLLNVDMKYMTSEMEQSLAVSLRIPMKFADLFRTLNPGARKNAVIHPNKKYYGKVEMTNQNITMETNLILPIFKFTVNGVIRVLESSLSDHQNVGICDVFVSGGFSEFPLLQDAMEEKFPDKNFYFVENPRDITMLGALVLGQERETLQTLGTLPIEAQRLSMEHQLTYSDAIQRGSHVTNHINLMIIGPSEVDKITFIRSFVGQQTFPIRGIQDGLFVTYIGRSKGLRQKTCVFPAPRDWEEQQIQGIPVMESIEKLQKLKFTSSSKQISSKSDKIHSSVYDQEVDVNSGEQKEHISRQKMHNMTFLTNSSAQSILCKNEGQRDSSLVSHETFLSKTKLLKKPSLRTNTSVFSSPPLPPISPRIQEETIVPCVFSIYDGLSHVCTQGIDVRHDAIFLLLFSLDEDITTNVTEGGLIDEWKISLPLLEYMTEWTRYIYAAYQSNGAGFPKIIPFGIYADKNNSVNLMRTRYKMIINTVRQACMGNTGMEKACQDYCLIACIKDSSSEGYDRLRSTILDIHEAFMAASAVKRPTAWIYMEGFLRQKKSVGVKVLNKEELKQLISNDQKLEISPEELDAFLICQHEKGTIIYEDGDGLENVIILNPKWPLVELLDLVTKEKKRINNNKRNHQSVVFSKSLINKHIKEARNLTDTEIKHLISFLHQRQYLCCPCLYDQRGEPVVPTFYIVPSVLETCSSGGILERLFHGKKAISLRYHFKSVPLLAPFFHRLLGAAMTAWQTAKHQGKDVMTSKMCAFVLDNFHRVVIGMDKNYITVTICNRKGNININPSICHKVQRYVSQNLHRILGIRSDLLVTTADRMDNGCFITEVSTCNVASPCYKSLNELGSQETWKCDFHQICGQSEDIMNVWFTYEQEPNTVLEDSYCRSDCTGLPEVHLSKPPSEAVIGRLVRRLDTDIIKRMARNLGLGDSIANLIEKEHKQDSWKLGFHFLHEAMVLLNKTTNDLVRVLDQCNQDVHLLCRVWRRQKKPDELIVSDRIDTPITTQELISIADNMSNDEFPLGIELGIGTDNICRIVENIPKAEETMVMHKILLEWKRKLASEATFRELSSALTEVKLDSICILNSVNIQTCNELY